MRKMTLHRRQTSARWSVAYICVIFVVIEVISTLSINTTTDGYEENATTSAILTDEDGTSFAESRRRCSKCPDGCWCTINVRGQITGSHFPGCKVRCIGSNMYQLPPIEQLPDLHLITALWSSYAETNLFHIGGKRRGYRETNQFKTDISSNEVRNVPVEYFQNFSVLNQIRLRDNPWQCDCTFRMVLALLIDGNVTVVEATRTFCDTPTEWKGSSINHFMTTASSAAVCVNATVKFLMPLKSPSVYIVATNSMINLSAELLVESRHVDEQEVICRWDVGDGSKPRSISFRAQCGFLSVLSHVQNYSVSGRYEATLSITSHQQRSMPCCDTLAYASAKVVVIDPISFLFVGSSGPVLVGCMAHIEVQVESGTDVQYSFRSLNSQPSTWMTYEDDSEDSVRQGALLTVAYSIEGTYFVQVKATNILGSQLALVAVTAIDETTLELAGVSTRNWPLSELPVGVDIELIADVVHWNPLSLQYSWQCSELALSLYGIGLRKVTVNIAQSGSYDLTLTVNGSSSTNNVLLQDSKSFELCTDNTAILSSSYPTYTPASNDVTAMDSQQLNRVKSEVKIGVAWPTAYYLLKDMEIAFFPMLPVSSDRANVVGNTQILDHFLWTFSDTTSSDGVPISVIGCTVTHVFHQVGIFNVTIGPVPETAQSSLTPHTITVRVQQEIRDVVVRFASTSVFDPIIAVGEDAKFVANTIPSIDSTDDNQTAVIYTWSFDDEPLPAPVLTAQPFVYYSFQAEGRNRSVTVSVKTQSMLTSCTATTTVDVRRPIVGLSIGGDCCSEVLPTEKNLTFVGSVVQGTEVTYMWRIGHIVEPEASIYDSEMLAGELRLSFRLPGLYRIGLSGRNYVSRQSVVNEVMVEEPVTRVTLYVSNSYCGQTYINEPITVAVVRSGGTNVRHTWSVVESAGGGKVRSSDTTPYEIISSTADNATFRFTKSGNYNVTYMTYNDVSSATHTRVLTVRDWPCDQPVVYLIGSRFRNETCSRRIRFETFVRNRCEQNMLVHQWSIRKGVCYLTGPVHAGLGDEIELPNWIDTDTPLLQLPGSTLSYGQYCVVFRSTYRCAPGISEVSVDLRVSASPLRALIAGGSERLVLASEQLTLDGSRSYDPDVSPNITQHLEYYWTCQSRNNILKVTNMDCPNWDSVNHTVDHIQLPKGSLLENTIYEITLSVASANRATVSTRQFIQAKSSGVQTVTVDCKSCRDVNSYNISQSQIVKLIGGCGGCRRRDVTFHWTIESMFTRKQLPVDFTTTTTGNGNMNLVVRSSVLTHPLGYRFNLTVSSVWTPKTRGFASLELGSTLPTPSGGKCIVETTKERLVALIDQVYVYCTNWSDNSGSGSPLEYLIYVVDTRSSWSPDSNLTDVNWYPIYRGTRTNTTFYVSPFSGHSGYVDLYVQIIDSLGSRNSTLLRRLFVQSLPPPSRIDFLLSLVHNNLSEVLLTSDPRLVQQFVITILLQLNIDAADALSEASQQTGSNSTAQIRDIDARTQMRADLLNALAKSVTIIAIQDVQQTGFALREMTCFIHEFPSNQSLYDQVINLLESTQAYSDIYVSQGFEGTEFMPQYLLDAAGNLVDIVSNDLDLYLKSESLLLEYQQLPAAIEDKPTVVSETHRLTIERTMALIDRVMMLIFQTHVADEQAVTFDTGFLHSSGIRASGLNVMDVYRSTSGSQVWFPKELIAKHYADMEIFQFASTLAINPYKWGYADGQEITTEVIRVTFVLAADMSYINLTALVENESIDATDKPIMMELKIGAEDKSDYGRFITVTADNSTQNGGDVDYFNDTRGSNIQAWPVEDDNSSCQATFLSPGQSVYTYVNLSAVNGGMSDLALVIDAWEIEAQERKTNSDLCLTVFVGRQRVAHQYDQDAAMTLHLKSDIFDAPRRHAKDRIFLSNEIFKGENGGFYLTLSNVNLFESMNVSLSLQIIQCKYLVQNTTEWQSDGCHVVNTTVSTTICSCETFAQFGATAVHTPSSFYFTTLTPSNYAGNAIVISAVCLTFLAMIVAIVLTKYWDKIDQQRLATVPLCGIDGPFRYEIYVFTGKRPGSGTTANVGVNLFSEDGLQCTGPRQLHRPGAFSRGAVDRFVVASDCALGPIGRVKIWHDNSGTSPGWYLDRLVVRQLATGISSCQVFIATRWLTLSTLYGKSEIETELTNTNSLTEFGAIFQLELSRRLSDQHLMISVIEAPPGTVCRRYERAVCCSLLPFVSLGLNTLWYGVAIKPTNFELMVGTSQFLPADIGIAAVTGFLVLTVTTIIFECIRHSSRYPEEFTDVNVRRMSAETVEMDADCSIYSSSLPSSREATPVTGRRRHRDVSDFIDLNCDVKSIDSMSVVNRPRQLHRTDAVRASKSDGNLVVDDAIFDGMFDAIPDGKWISPAVDDNSQAPADFYESGENYCQSSQRTEAIRQWIHNNSTANCSTDIYPDLQVEADCCSSSSGDGGGSKVGLTTEVELVSSETVAASTAATNETNIPTLDDIPWHPNEKVYKCAPAVVNSSKRLTDYRVVIEPSVTSGITPTSTTSSCDRHLPYWCRPLMVALSAITSLAFAIVTLVIGHQFNADLSVRWIVVSVVTMAFVAVFDLLKILIIAIITSAVTETYDLSKMHCSRQSCLESYEETMTKIRPLGGFALLRAREDGRKQAMLKRMLGQSVVYILLMLTVTVATYSTCTGRTSFLVHREITHRFTSPSFSDYTRNFSTISSIDDFWLWFTEVSVPTWSTSESVDPESVYVGLARLRQQRYVSAGCLTSPNYFMATDLNGICSGYPVWAEDKASYDLGWHNSSLASESANLSTNTGWSYLNDQSLHSTSHIGEVDRYNGGGYVIELDPLDYNKTMNTSLFLWTNNWIDFRLLKDELANLAKRTTYRTRVVFVEFTTYNVAHDVYSASTLVIEFDMAGGIHTTSEVRPFRLMSSSDNGTGPLILEIIMFIISVYLIVEVALAIRQFGANYLVDIWNYVDVFVAILVVTSFGMFLAVVSQDDVLRRAVISVNNPSSPPIYICFDQSAELQEDWRAINATLMFVLILITVRQLRYVRTMTTFSYTLKVSLPVLVLAFVVFFITTVGYSLLGTLWYGGTVYSFRSVGNAVAWMSASVRRQTPFLNQMSGAQGATPGVGPDPAWTWLALLFMASYQTIVWLIAYAALIVASLTRAYRIVRRQMFRYNAAETRDYEMIDFMIRQFKKWIGITKPKPTNRRVQFQTSDTTGSPNCSFSSSPPPPTKRADHQQNVERDSESCASDSVREVDDNSSRLNSNRAHDEIDVNGVNDEQESFEGDSGLSTSSVCNSSIKEDAADDAVTVAAANADDFDSVSCRHSSLSDDSSDDKILADVVDDNESSESIWSDADSMLELFRYDDVIDDMDDDADSDDLSHALKSPMWDRLAIMLRKIEEHDHEVDKQLWLIANRCRLNRGSCGSRRQASSGPVEVDIYEDLEEQHTRESEV